MLGSVRFSSAMFTIIFDCIQENYSIQLQNKLISLYCSSCGDIRHTSLQPFTVFKINSSRHNNIIAFEMLINNKYDIEFVTEFPCLLGHPVQKISPSVWNSLIFPFALNLLPYPGRLHWRDKPS